jgi:hypothetical protein
LVFLAAARLAETPRVVKAPARAEAEAIVVVCGCCDAVARGKYDRQQARAPRLFSPYSLFVAIIAAIWKGNISRDLGASPHRQTVANPRKPNF